MAKERDRARIKISEEHLPFEIRSTKVAFLRWQHLRNDRAYRRFIRSLERSGFRRIGPAFEVSPSSSVAKQSRDWGLDQPIHFEEVNPANIKFTDETVRYEVTDNKIRIEIDPFSLKKDKLKKLVEEILDRELPKLTGKKVEKFHNPSVVETALRSRHYELEQFEKLSEKEIVKKLCKEFPRLEEYITDYGGRLSRNMKYGLRKFKEILSGKQSGERFWGIGHALLTFNADTAEKTRSPKRRGERPAPSRFMKELKKLK